VQYGKDSSLGYALNVAPPHPARVRTSANTVTALLARQPGADRQEADQTAKYQCRKTTHLIAQYMYAASQIPATNRDSWYCTPKADNAVVTPRMKAR
jgi:hypothetical protein